MERESSDELFLYKARFCAPSLRELTKDEPREKSIDRREDHQDRSRTTPSSADPSSPNLRQQYDNPTVYSDPLASSCQIGIAPLESM